MTRCKLLVASVMLLLAAIGSAAPASLAAPASPAAALSTAHAPPAAPAARTPAAASELWATVDVCNAPTHPNTIGIRGSMPGDGHPHDVMYMRFLVQSLDATTNKWADIGRSADSGFVRIGSGAVTRQAGRTFEFKPTTMAYTLRGLVEFQWHRGGRTVRTTTRTTSGGHTSVAGAEPKGFSAASCVLM
jgi:hypothetical protein